MAKTHIRKITFAGVVAAFYAALTLAAAPISYGPLQFRVAEALCVIPFFFPVTSAGLFVGCVIANLFSPYGILDIAAGSAATLIATLLTARIGRVKASRNAIWIKALACFPPVIVNALIIPAVIAGTATSGGESFRAAYMINAIQIGLEQFAVMYAIGLPLMINLPKSRLYGKLSEWYRL